MKATENKIQEEWMKKQQGTQYFYIILLQRQPFTHSHYKPVITVGNKYLRKILHAHYFRFRRGTSVSAALDSWVRTARSRTRATPARARTMASAWTFRRVTTAPPSSVSAPTVSHFFCYAPRFSPIKLQYRIKNVFAENIQPDNIVFSKKSYSGTENPAPFFYLYFYVCCAECICGY